MRHRTASLQRGMPYPAKISSKSSTAIAGMGIHIVDPREIVGSRVALDVSKLSRSLERPTFEILVVSRLNSDTIFSAD